MSPCMTLAPRARTRARCASLGPMLALLIVLAGALAPRSALAAPQLLVPTPAGEDWKIIQGYACGTHNAWDRYSLDLAQVGGPTYGAAIRAALGGTVWHWEGSSGTLILSHGGGFFTMYTHMGSAVTTARGHYIEAGETLGFAGDRGSPGVPHLHFTAFTANRDGWSGKQSVPLHFVEGYNLPEVGGCNQHGGTVLRAMAIQPPEISFSSAAQPETWYNSDQRIEFTSSWSGGGLSQAWDSEPPDDAPMFAQATDGYAQLSDKGEGLRTLYVRVWGPDGKQTLASYGPVGYDITPPVRPAPVGELRTLPDVPLTITWTASKDNASGTAGYRVYIGPQADGTDAWFTPEAKVKTPPLKAGTYYVRVQPLDKASNMGEWATIGTIVVAPPAP